MVICHRYLFRFSVLPNDFRVNKNVGNPDSNITKPVYTMEVDVRHTLGTKNICNTAASVRNISICYNCSPFGSRNCNFNVAFLYASVPSCDRTGSYSCFRNHVNGIKSNKIVCKLIVHKVVKNIFVATSPVNS